MSEKPAANNGLTGHRLVARRTLRYYEALRWMIFALVRFSPFRVATIIGLITAGRAMQAAAFAGVIWYFSAVETNEPVLILGQSIDPRDGMWMAVVIAGVAGALIAATFLIYISARMGFYLSMSFAELIIRTMLDEDRAFPAQMALARNGATSLQALEVASAKLMLFRPVNVLMSMPRYLLLAVPAIAGMIWIAGEVVAFLLVIAIPAIAMNYFISHRVVVAQRNRKVAQKAYRNAMRDTLDGIADESAPNPDRPTLSASLMASEANHVSLAIFATRILSPKQSEFASNVTAAVAIAAIGFYLGYEALSGAIPLAMVIGFFVLLRLAITGLTSIAVSLTTYARFYSVIRAAYEYLTSPIRDPKPFTGKLALNAAKQDEPAPGSLEEEVKVERGKPVAIIAPAEINRYTQYFFAFALTQRSRQSTRENLNAATLRCTAALADPAVLEANGLLALTEETLAERLKGRSIADIAPTPDTIRKAGEGAEALKRTELARVALLTAVLSSADFILIEPRLVRHLPKGELESWLTALEDRFIALGYGLGRFKKCIAGETHAVLMDNERAVAVVEAKDAAAAARYVEANLKPGDDEEFGGDLDEDMQ